RDGRVVQVGPPEEVYERPANTFVASFFGEANIIPADGRGYMIVRPEDVMIGGVDGADYRLEGVVEDVVFQGPLTYVYVRVDGTTIRAALPRGRPSPRPGERVAIGWRASSARVVAE
ncbi:MAG: TOBE domain-containing protein, partial [Desulfurococcales archaeon]|nr:TOBE domain-containing protein [Desulfurococcales archaeon]